MQALTRASGFTVLGLLLTTPVLAADWPAGGDWLVRAGFHQIDPKSDNLSLGAPFGNVNVRDDTAPTFSVSYFFTPAIAIELQAATPFNHDIDLSELGKVGSTKHLPPTLSVQYHVPMGAVKPYVGAGVNWTIFFDEETTGALNGAELELDDSVGLGVQVGLDYQVGPDWYLNTELRWIDINSDANVNVLGDIGEVEIDPIAFAVTIGRKF